MVIQHDEHVFRRFVPDFLPSSVPYGSQVAICHCCRVCLLRFGCVFVIALSLLGSRFHVCSPVLFTCVLLGPFSKVMLYLPPDAAAVVGHLSSHTPVDSFLSRHVSLYYPPIVSHFLYRVIVRIVVVATPSVYMHIPQFRQFVVSSCIYSTTGEGRNILNQILTAPHPHNTPNHSHDTNTGGRLPWACDLGPGVFPFPHLPLSR